MLAALVAAAGLGVTAWGTLVSADVAEDQLAQSKVQKEERDRRQASRINWWEEQTERDAGDRSVFIANRSLDPAYVWLWVEIQAYQGANRGPFPQQVKFTATWGTVPPCTLLSIPDADTRMALMGITPVLTEDMKFVDPDPKHYFARFESFGFTDTQGQTWRRSDSHGGLTLDPSPWKTINEYEAVSIPIRREGVKTEPLEECGSEG
ncbi:hypothetical protein ACWEGS_28415 [Streptomyces sp. NPDC004822]